MQIKIGKTIEVEITVDSLFIKLGNWERFYNNQGLPSGSDSSRRKYG